MANRMDPVVKKETSYVTAWVAAGCMLTQGVCLVAGWWSLPVLLGSVLGGVTAAGNFLLMCLTVQRAVNRNKKDAESTVRLSQSGRLMMQGAVLVTAGLLPQVFNLWTTVIPLLIPRIAVGVRSLQEAKNNPVAAPADGDENEEEEA